MTKSVTPSTGIKDAFDPKKSDMDQALTRIAGLAVASTDPQIVDISTKNLGYGLPETVHVLWDRLDQSPISLKSEVEVNRIWPARCTGTADAQTLKSFINLVNRHKDEHSVIFGNTAWPDPALTAIIDYHQIDHAPRWGKHRIVYKFPLTDEFKAWIKHNSDPMSQFDFANFLEDHAAELAAPLNTERQNYESLFREKFATPIELVDLSRSLEVYQNAHVKHAGRISTGEREIIFKQENTDAHGQKVEVPGIFMISVPAFVDGSPVRIPARLRYRVSGGSIVWFYDLYRWEFWLRTQVQNDLLDAASETSLPAFEGRAEV